MDTPQLPTPLDPDARAMLELFARAGYPPLEACTPSQARAAYAKSWSATQSPGIDVASVTDATTGAEAAALRVRVYRPRGIAADALLPGLLYLHGGGWVIGGLDSHDSTCRRLCQGAVAVVVAVDYRLAPEHPFPAAVEDGARTLRWMAAEGRAWGIDTHALAVAGDSAGGNLAAVLALMSRDGTVPPLRHQALLYPVTDLAAEAPSYRSVRGPLPLTAATMRYFIGHYAPRPEDRLDWRASPMQVRDLQGLPPALVLTVAHDPLCDEGRAYAARLTDAGVPVDAVHLPDQLHGLFGMSRLVAAADPLLDRMAARIGLSLRGARAPARPDRPSTEEPPQRPSTLVESVPSTQPCCPGQR